MKPAASGSIEISSPGIVRPLDTAQIRKLMRMRGADRNLAGAALAAGMTVARFKTLPAGKQQEIQAAYLELTAPESIPAPPAGPERPRKPSLRDFGEQERIALGRRLLAVKAQLPRGHFGLWCKEKSGLGHNTIRVCMKMAERAAPDRTR